MIGTNRYLMLSGIANVALIPRILDVGSLRGFYEDKLSVFAMDDSNKVWKEMVEGALGVIVA